jgi:predicted metal-dependent hydrolase
VRYTGIHIKEQKSRWGSCSAKGNLNFNWHIVMAPETIADYLVIHELCHLRHMNHSAEFWHCVSGLYPAYKTARKWLKENGISLRNW